MAIARNISINSETFELEPSKGQRVYVGTCSTAAATNPKVCTVEDFPVDGNGKPYKGTEIVVKFTATNTSTSTTPELNVNGTGAIRIWYNNAVLASAKSAFAGYANRYMRYVYDGTYWVFMGHSVDNNSTYSNVALGQGYAVQNNSAASAAITAALGSYALTVNGIVSVKFIYDVPANATLNINGKGAKAIYNKGAAITAGVIKGGDTATFMFVGSGYYQLLSVDRWQDKQDALVSGTNIKTINNQSLLGSGDITIASGKSAYEVAVDEGYSGTEASWVASLKGEKGDKGDTGNVQVDGDGNVLIVNDLTTGGTGAALSAEQGKVLNRTRIFNAPPVLKGIYAYNGVNVGSSAYRKFSFDDIKYLDVHSRLYLRAFTSGTPFYQLDTLFGITDGSGNYLAVGKKTNSELSVVLYKNSTLIHESAALSASANWMCNHQLSFDFVAKRVVLTRGYRDGTSTVMNVVDMSSWDFSGMEGKQVYFYKRFHAHTSYDYLFTYIKLNNPTYNTLTLYTLPYTVDVFNQMAYNDVVNRGSYITGLYARNTTVTETISATHKKFSFSKSSYTYFSFYGSGSASLYPNNGTFIISGAKFKLLSGTPSFTNGRCGNYVLKPDGTMVSAAGFTPEVGTEYTFITAGTTGDAGYMANNALYASGTFEFEAYDPFVITPQYQLLAGETFEDGVFTGSIPFAAYSGAVELKNYNPYKDSGDYMVFYHQGELKFNSDKVYMWNGTAWKQISNA